MSSQDAVAVLGAGGHAKVVISTLRAAAVEIGGVFENIEARWEQTILGLEILGPFSLAAQQGYRRGIVAVGGNRDRALFVDEADLEWVTVVHPTAWLDPSVQAGAGTVVFANSVIQPDTTLGAHVIVNTSASIDHDCSIGDYSHIGPGACLGGDIRIGRGVLLGVGCSVKPGVTIGDWAVVGAGAAVTADIAAESRVAGVPARPLT